MFKPHTFCQKAAGCQAKIPQGPQLSTWYSWWLQRRPYRFSQETIRNLPHETVQRFSKGILRPGKSSKNYGCKWEYSQENTYEKKPNPASIGIYVQRTIWYVYTTQLSSKKKLPSRFHEFTKSIQFLQNESMYTPVIQYGKGTGIEDVFSMKNGGCSSQLC